MQGHLGKPIDPDELHGVVATYCQSIPVSEEQESPAQPAAHPGSAAADSDLPRIAGLDVDEGLGRTRGKKDLYLRLLGEFPADFGDFADRMTELMRDGKSEDARRLAHSLKGVAGTLGANGVAKSARLLEDAVARREPTDRALAAVNTELRPVLDGLSAFFGNEVQSAEHPAIQPDRHVPHAQLLPDWLEDLRRLLADGDIAAQQLWEARGEELKDLLPVQVYGQVRRAVQNFEFESALRALEQK
jgi:two-component system sensor histidine kinase/response regulator